MTYNSTIRPKLGVCPMCPHERKQPLTKGLCQVHYWQSVNMRAAAKFAEKEVIEEEGLPQLIEEADALFSRYIRLKAADERGIYPCYICGKPTHYKRGDLMHFIGRLNYLLRWDSRNCKEGCVDCNQLKRGNLAEFAKKLNEEQPGLADILWEESRIVYKPTREEVRQIIGEYSTKLKHLQRCHS